MVLGQVFAEGFDDGLHLPDEDPRIPVELAGLKEGLRQLEVGFFGEALDLADGVVVRDLNVAVARVGARGFDAHGQQGVVPVGELEAFADDRAEIVLVEDQVIRRRDDHLGIGVLPEQRIGRIGDAGGRIAADRLAEHLFLPDFGDMLQHQILVFVVRHDEEIPGGDDFCEALVGMADKRFSGSQDVEELFWHRLPALGPETRSDAAGHDDTIFIACHKL